MQGGNERQPSEDNTYDYQEQPHVNAPVPGAVHRSGPEVTPSSTQTATDATDDAVVTWEASEYIHHQKNSSWYLGFAGIMLIVITVLFFLLRDILSVVVLVLMGVAVAVYAGRKPETIRYSLGHSGLGIGDKHYDFDNFSSFALMQEGAIYSVTLMPTKRFLPPVSIYFAPDDGEKITQVLSEVLPHEDREPDFIDRLMRNIRF